MDKSVEESVAGGAWLFLSNAAISAAGLAFWLVVARLAGVESVGAAGAVVSAAGVAATLASSGLTLAVAREVAVRNLHAVTVSITLSLIAGPLAGLLGVGLIGALDYEGFTLYAGLLALLMVLSQAFSFILVGLEEFAGFFKASLASSIAKLGLGAALAWLGYGLLAPLAGFLAFPLIMAASSLLIITLRLGRKAFKPGTAGLGELALLTVSNYPFMLSSQLLTVLSVYAFALFSGEEFSTGVLYIAMTASLAVASVPASLLNADLPVAARRGSDPFTETLRLGLALTTPLIAGLLAATGPILGLINPELSQGSTVLTLLLLAVTPLTVLTAATNKLNKELNRTELTVIGTVRLVSLLALIYPLTTRYSVEGAAAAYLIANMLPLPLAFRHLPGSLIPSISFWGLQAGIPFLLSLSNLPVIASLVAAPVIALAAIHASKIAKLNEIANTIKHALTSLFRSQY